MNIKRILTGYSLAHFLVDMGCAMLIYHIASYYTGSIGASPVMAVLAYDFFAFVTELPFGAVLDHISGRYDGAQISYSNKNGLIAACGCVVIAILDILAFADIIIAGAFIPVAVVLGMANAAFHLGAGIDVINLSERKASFSGIFISTGALGLFLGTQALSMHYENLLIMGLALLCMSAYILWEYFHETAFIQNKDDTVIKAGLSRIFLALALLFLVIFYRSFLGFASKYSWRSGFVIGLVATLAVVVGKAAGGIIADRFGWKRTIMASMLVCAVLAVFSDASAIAGCLMLLLFNMTMPIAMIGLANLLPSWKGVAFGLNTVALFLGFVTYRMVKIPVSGVMLGALILLSVVILLTAMHIAPDMERGWDN